MAKYEVSVAEVWSRSFVVEAESYEGARALANIAIEVGDEGDIFEYSHTLDTDDWYVNKIED
jgi:hypothetical protein